MTETAQLRARRNREEDYTLVELTREQVIAAFKQYDTDYPKNDFRDKGHDPWLEDDIDRPGAYEWAVWFEGRCYPGKYVLRCATGYQVFHGGWGEGNANEVLDTLGFRITPRPELGRDWRNYRRPAKYL